MTKAVQAKHIEDRRVLWLLADARRCPRRYPDTWAPGEMEPDAWVFTWDMEIALAEFPPKVIAAKMASLIRRGLVSGCACGCRGDFQITGKGREMLKDYEG